MKVFVVTSHLEYDGCVPETYVEGVFEKKEDAVKVMKEVYTKQVETNPSWQGEDDGDYTIDEKEGKYKDILNNLNNDYVRVEIWESEVE